MIEDEAEKFFNDKTKPYPFIKEIDYDLGIRKIKIKFELAYIITIIILIVVQLILMAVGFIAFKHNNEIKILFCVLELPLILAFLLVPANAICIYDYNAKTFRSYPVGIIPIPCRCFSNVFVNFCDIAGFFVKKVTKRGKRNYKIGVKLNDGQELTIMVGQNPKVKCSCTPPPEEVDEMNYIPFLLKKYLKPGETNMI